MTLNYMNLHKNTTFRKTVLHSKWTNPLLRFSASLVRIFSLLWGLFRGAINNKLIKKWHSTTAVTILSRLGACFNFERRKSPRNLGPSSCIYVRENFHCRWTLTVWFFSFKVGMKRDALALKADRETALITQNKDSRLLCVCTSPINYRLREEEEREKERKTLGHRKNKFISWPSHIFQDGLLLQCCTKERRKKKRIFWKTFLFI